MNARLILISAVSASLAGAASAAPSQCITRFELTASPGDSLAMSISLPLSGTFKGNHDPVTNPGGTQTRPGLFGGSGNNPIPYSATVKPGVTLDLPQGVPVFTFCVGDDDGKGGVEVTCGDLDFVRGASVPLTIGLTITYPNFNTINPTAIFPGVSNLTIPLPAGSISEARAVQSAPTMGVLAPGKGGSLILTAVLPMDLTFDAEVLGTVISETTPILLPIAAELLPSLEGDYVAQVVIEVPKTETTLPTGGQTIEDQPFDLPTVLPPGNTAHLLVSGTFGDGTLSFGMSADLSGDGSAITVPQDLNGDCKVDGDDLGTLLGQWGICPGCSADFNDDGLVDGDDLGTLLGAWG